MRIKSTFQHGPIQAYKFAYSPFGKPKLGVHLYYIDGLLIDTGQSRMRKVVAETVSSLAVEQIYITHYHEDHSGNVHLLSQYFQCPAFSSRLCCALMKSPPPISFAQYVSWGPRAAYPHLQVKEDFIETDKYHFQIIPIPGHAVDMVALYEANEGWLFSADLYVHNYISYMLTEESIKTQIESISTILELDFDTLFCSHNPQLQSGKKRLSEKLHFLEEFYDKVASEYRKGKTAKAVFQDLQLNEKWFVRFLSHGCLSKMNMVRSVIRDERNSSL